MRKRNNAALYVCVRNMQFITSELQCINTTACEDRTARCITLAYIWHDISTRTDFKRTVTAVKSGRG